MKYAKYLAIICCSVGALMIIADFNVPPSFGKTHFIVGYPTDATAQQADGSVVQTVAGGVCRVLFAPDDDVQEALIHLIEQETTSICAAIYMLTDKEIARALMEAHRRGITVEVVTDRACVRERWSKMHKLCKAGVPVYVYEPSTAEDGGNDIMHNKFVIFGANGGNRKLVWTGSCNFTRSAKLRNQENAVVIDDGATIEKFCNQFTVLKTRSKSL